MSDELLKILESIPWRCFHCDFVTTDRATAAAHFGERDDPEEFKPICRWWENLAKDERVETLQDTLRQLNSERDENQSLRTKVDGLEYQVNSQEGCIKSYKPFRDCHSIHEVFCLYDSMEGRALAAEEANKPAHPPITPTPPELPPDWMREPEIVIDLVKEAMRTINHFSLGGMSVESEANYNVLMAWLKRAESGVAPKRQK
jgi:hypothetical protein